VNEQKTTLACWRCRWKYVGIGINSFFSSNRIKKSTKTEPSHRHELVVHIL